LSKLAFHASGSDQRTLLRELNHRIANDFTAAINLVSLAAVRAESAEAKIALSGVVELLLEHGEVQQALAMPDGDGLVDAAQHVRKLGRVVSRGRLKRVGVNLVFAADKLPVEAERCWRLALVVHELVTNAARHASFDGRYGEIRIELKRAGAFVSCSVSDNGSGAAGVKAGRGLKIVTELASSLGGWLDHDFGAEGTSFTLVFPLTEREQQANQVIASRRARTARPLKAVRPQPSSQTAERNREPLGSLLGGH
jgi:two-component sensor histidine kinase